MGRIFRLCGLAARLRWTFWPARARRTAGISQAAALLAVFFTPGCTEHSALPTWPPFAQDNTQGDWQRIYPAVTGEDLNAAWGMDANDMWIVGNSGTLLHFDGQVVRSIEPLTARDLVAIDGCARDEIWAVSSNGEVLRWDGRRWSMVWNLSTDLETVLCLAPDDVYVGGRNNIGERQPSVWHHDGRQWTFMPLAQDVSYSRVRRIWHPGPEFPLMAAADNSLSWLDGDAWHQTAAAVRFRDAAQDMILAVDPSNDHAVSVYRLKPDGALIQECGQPSIQRPNLIVSSQLHLLGYSNSVWSLDDCLRIEVWRSPFVINDLAVPILPGTDGCHVFAIGRACGFARLTWQPDLSLSAEMLLPEAHNRRVLNLAGDGTDLYFRDTDGRVYRGGFSAWQDIQAPFWVSDIKMLATGTLAIFNWDTRIAVLLNDDTWEELPRFNGYVQNPHWWIDEELRPRVLHRPPRTNRWELWGLDGADWALLLDLCAELDNNDIYPISLAGFGLDDLYIHCYISSFYRLLHHDGHSLRQLDVDADLGITAIMAGPHTRRLYLEGSTAHQSSISGYLKDGALTILGHRRGWIGLVEASEDLVFCHTGTRIFQLGAGGWTDLTGPDNRRYSGLWGHPDQGLFVVSDRQEIYRSELPPGAR